MCILRLMYKYKAYIHSAQCTESFGVRFVLSSSSINNLAMELEIKIVAHHLCKM